MFYVYSYIADSLDLDIIYNVRSGFNLECYTDLDWAESYVMNVRKSTTGFTWNICEGTVLWKSVLQKFVTTSSTIAEVIAANHAAEEEL